MNDDKKDAINQNLKDAGCDEVFIEQLLQLLSGGYQKDSLRMLSCYRCSLLEEVHRHQRRLTCLDYLIYQMKHGCLSLLESSDEPNEKKGTIINEKNSNHINELT